jgi:eight-cysteine-cluster-containing protein
MPRRAAPCAAGAGSGVTAISSHPAPLVRKYRPMRALLAGALLSLAACTIVFDDVKGEQNVGGGNGVPGSDGTCFIGGCSSQICSDQEDVVSTCEWREEYACYKTATCARQADGRCGWTPTPELRACLEAR